MGADFGANAGRIRIVLYLETLIKISPHPTNRRAVRLGHRVGVWRVEARVVMQNSDDDAISSYAAVVMIVPLF